MAGGEAYGTGGRRPVAVSGTAEIYGQLDLELRIEGWLASPVRFAGRPIPSTLDTLAGMLSSPSNEHSSVVLVLARQPRQ